MIQDPRQEFRSILKDTRHLLESLQAGGITKVPAPEGFSRKGLSKNKNKETILEPIRRKALVCQACRLCKTRTQVVFGEGSLDARLAFVGEGPGREEDLQGRPFVGAAGTLLTRIIQAMKLQRESVYIANVVKCRPPQNRPPEPDEIEACHDYLEAQLLTIRPKVICALGRTAATALLETNAPMSTLRGRTFKWKEIPLIVTFHPAYLLRNPPAKKLVWQDMQLVLAILAGRPSQE